MHLPQGAQHLGLRARQSSADDGYERWVEFVSLDDQEPHSCPLLSTYHRGYFLNAMVSMQPGVLDLQNGVPFIQAIVGVA